VTPAELAALVRACVAAAIGAGEFGGDVPAEVDIERPKNPDHGDYAANVALRLAKAAGRPAREVADLIAARLRESDGIAKVDVAGPGFLNITLAAGTLGAIAHDIVTAGAAYGQSDELAGQRVNLEFVSANPTGPVHLGGTRWAALGDSLHRLLEAAGADVAAEHYINDAGSQTVKFAESLYAVAHGRPVPDDGFHGDYVADVAETIVKADPGVLELPDNEAVPVFSSAGERLMLDALRQSLAGFRVEFDVWFSERSLHDSGAVDAAIERLREQGHVYDADGAVWLRTTDFVDDKDRVIVRISG
jgi:arginyl-tRNA synthetase